MGGYSTLLPSLQASWAVPDETYELAIRPTSEVAVQDVPLPAASATTAEFDAASLHHLNAESAREWPGMGEESAVASGCTWRLHGGLDGRDCQ